MSKPTRGMRGTDCGWKRSGTRASERQTMGRTAAAAPPPDPASSSDSSLSDSVVPLAWRLFAACAPHSAARNCPCTLVRLRPRAPPLCIAATVAASSSAPSPTAGGLRSEHPRAAGQPKLAAHNFAQLAVAGGVVAKRHEPPPSHRLTVPHSLSFTTSAKRGLLSRRVTTCRFGDDFRFWTKIKCDWFSLNFKMRFAL